MSPRTGRPLAEEPKETRFSIRLDANTEMQLEDYCKKNGKTKGEVIRHSLIVFLNQEIEKKKYKDEEEHLKKLRKRVEKYGYGIRKGKLKYSSDAIHWYVQKPEQVGYMLFSYETNTFTHGFSSNYEYALSLEEVEEIVSRIEYNNNEA
jgi:predicted DNA-binding protein